MLRNVACALAFAVVLVFTLLVAGTARAECERAPGAPPECCVTSKEDVRVPLPEHVRVGLRLVHLSRISEREGTFYADMYIMTRWRAGGPMPDLRIRNAADAPNIVEDRVDKVGDLCYRARRIQDDMETPYLLRRFPFDRQKLRIVLEDASWVPDQYTYEPELFPLTIGKEAYAELAAWKFTSYPTMLQRDAGFAYHPGDTPSRVLTIEIPVEREWQFYLTRYFLPLLLIVALSYSVFYIKADDLASSSGLGITAVLAVIAFQLTQTDAMPKVGYMTLADKVYSVCYLFTAGALALAIHGAWLATHGEEARAERNQRRYRVAFAALFALAFIGAAYWGWAAGNHEGVASDAPSLREPPPPPGEVKY